MSRSQAETAIAGYIDGFYNPDLNARGIVGKRGGKFHASTIKAVCDNDLHDVPVAA